MFYLRTKGQSTLEYVILLGFVVAALIAMGVYMKRGTEGQLRQAVDNVGEQYEAGKTTGEYNVKNEQTQHESLSGGADAGHTTTNLIKNEQTKLGGKYETVEAMPD